MQKTIIVVRGFPKSGKTTVTHRAFDELRQEASRVIEWGSGDKEVIGGILDIDGVTVGFNSRGDVAKPVEEDLNRLIDGVKVGFNSRGDVAKPVEEDLKRLIRNNCAVIVCAARRSTYGLSVTFQAVMRCAAQAQPQFNVVVIEKHSIADNQEKVEEIKAAVRTAVAAARQAELVEA